MKKHFKILSILLLTIAVAAMLCGCAAPGAPDYDVSASQNIEIDGKNIANDIADELTAFIENNPDRTTFGEGERAAADYLLNRMIAFGYSDAHIQDFTAEENGVSGLNSQNVIAKLSAANRTEDTKNIVLGAYYDNRYSQSYKNAMTIKSEAALAGGSGVATLLAVAKYFKDGGKAYDFDITMVFFGAGYLYTRGADEYLRGGMSVEERKNTVLMVEFQRLGVDHVYMYADERETKREPLFDEVAKANGLDIYKPTQKSPIITGTTVTEGVPFYRWAHNGLFSSFADYKIPTLNLVGANWETVNMSDAESSEHANIAYTEKDNLTQLRTLYPDCEKKMATAAALVIRSLEMPNFIEAMTADRTDYPDTSILTMYWVWGLVVIGMLILVCAALFLVYRHLDKKYKPQPLQPRRMKMAVFGMDYEDKDSADIFVDIRGADEDIFPGVPNNDGVQKDPADDIFPPAQQPPETADDGKDDGEGSGGDGNENGDNK